MINLTPIAKNIQQRLFEKMRVLGRANTATTNTPKNGELTHKKMASRSPFVRMSSGQLNAVTLMGGILKDNSIIRGGFDEIYGTRTYKKRGTEKTKEIDVEGGSSFEGAWEGFTTTVATGEFNINTTDVNKGKMRPMPGIKSIDVSFKGGVRALREATISWTCWSWDELEELMPHFLAHGQTVLLQWGWVYDEGSLAKDKIPTFLHTERGETHIKASAYSNYQKEVNDSKGDFDMMVGIIKNFEFTTRDDGGFDCQTILTSVGVSILQNSEPNSSVKDPSVIYNLSLDDKTEEIANKIKRATGDEGLWRHDKSIKNMEVEKVKRDITTAEQDSLIKLNSVVTLKSFIANIDDYLLQDISNTLKSGREASSKAGTYTVGEYQVKANKYVLRSETDTQVIPGAASGLGGSINISMPTSVKNAWIRWGWFEDNILSKFLTITNEKEENKIVSSFRSIENKFDKDGNPNPGKYESVRIKNHQQLETIDLNHYILPSQFNVVEEQDLKDDDGSKLATIPGDAAEWIELAAIVNNAETFEPFATSFIKKTKTVKYKKLKWENLMDEQKRDPKEFDADFSQQGGVRVEEQEISYEMAEVKNYETGYLRNMLINTNLIKDAFGVDRDNNTFTVESINVYEALESLFSSLNRDINFWNFAITSDTHEPSRTKIVDEQITAIDFNKKDPINSNLTKMNVVGRMDGNQGIFQFPVWKNSSFVKRQNITAKIPDAMQLAIMYGGAGDALKDFANFGSRFGEPSAIAAGLLYNKPKSRADIAILNDFSEKIGNANGNADEPLDVQNSTDDVMDYIRKNTNRLETTYEDRLKLIDAELNTKDIIDDEEIWTKLFDDSLPPPLFSSLTLKQKREIFITLEESFEAFPDSVIIPDYYKGKRNIEKKKTLSSTALRAVADANKQLGILVGSNFDATGRLKPKLIKSVNYYTANFGIAKANNNPILIPLELELEIDGIGGIYPGNSFHSSYVPKKYQNTTVFQAFDVNHKVGTEGWTVTISGKMRSSINTIMNPPERFGEKVAKQLKNYSIKAKAVAEALKKAGDEDWATIASGYGAP
jgi:hypothetical protein